MIEVLWLGRGGQGAFTAAKLLGAAYVHNTENHYALAFPTFGPERRGAPMKAFTKLDDTPILDRSEIEKADYIVILDETLYHNSLQNALKPNGKIVMNTKKVSPSAFLSFDADELANQTNKKCTNTIMLGVLLKYSKIVSPKAMKDAITAYFPESLQQINIEALTKIQSEEKEKGRDKDGNQTNASR